MKESIRGVQTLIDLLRDRAQEQPGRLAYEFDSGAGGIRPVTYAELDLRARALGARLQSEFRPGERALLLYAPGFDYLAAFWGCLYAGLLAVPAYPPRSNGNLERLLAVVRDSEASVALTTPDLLAGIGPRLAETPLLAGLRWVATAADELADGSLWKEPALSGDSLCFLQYTSGSTGTPKGVMLSHGNLLHNLGLIERAFETSPHSRGVVWLPPYHDMGLIGGILQPLHTGYPMTLMAPVDFITKPLRWLEAVSRTKATVSGGPNFAYELCVQKILPEQREGLDLSAWDTAFTGAEPIRAETLRKFAEYFAPCGFREEAFYSCYGLAEATLFVVGGLKREKPAEAVLEGRTLVSSGRVEGHGQTLLVVDPSAGRTLPAGEVGEIWLSGPSVAQGYWQQPGRTEEEFEARLAERDGGHGPFLRTGDLGFVQDGELYVTGRLKDLIIIRGRNHYPQDIEYTAALAHEAVKPDAGAAFSVEWEGEERLVLVQEVQRRFRKANLHEVAAAIRERVAREHELSLHAVVLLKPAAIPKTSSGKIQRRTCRERYLQGGLDELLRDEYGVASSDRPYEQEGSGQDPAGADQRAGERAVPGREELLELPSSLRLEALTEELIRTAARVMSVPAARVHADSSLTSLGLDSLMAVELTHEIGEEFGASPGLGVLLEGASVREIASLILQEVARIQEEPAAARLPAEWRTAEDADAPLSDGQRSLWFLHRLSPQSAAYHIARAVRLPENVNAEALRRCFAELAKRHGSLRTTFHLQDGAPRQKVHADAGLPFRTVSSTGWTDEQLRAALQEESERSFDLEQGPLWRVHLFERANGPVLLLTLHHIIADFWSLGVLVRELLALYERFANGRQTELPEPGPTYVEAARQRAQLLAGPQGETLWAYWREQLAGDLSPLQLPTDRPRPPLQTYAGAVLSLPLGQELTAGIKRLAQEQGATLYMTLLAAFGVLLARCGGRTDVRIGSPSAGRSRAREADVFGYFVNTLVLRAQAEPSLPFTDFLAQIRQTVLGALDHQDFPFTRLVEKLAGQRDPSFPPLVQVMFVLQRSHALDSQGLTPFALGEGGVRLDGPLPLESVALEQRAAQFDLTLQAAETAHGLLASFEYNADLFDRATIERMAGHFRRLLAGIVQAPERTLSSLPMLDAAEREKMLTLWNDTDRDYPRDRSVAALFEEQAAATPDRVALVLGDEQITYGVLNARANQAARRLRSLGVKPHDPVTLCMERSPELIIGLLAILKAGGAYVPIDTEYPAERIAFLLEDAGAQVMVTKRSIREELGGLAEGIDTLCLDGDEPLWTEEQDANLLLESTSETPAYILYTSGTTGRPKGVCVPQRGITRLVKNNPFVDFSPSGVFLQMSLISFDAATFEIWGALLNGGRLVLFPPEKLTAGKLAQELERHQISTVFFTSALFNQMVDHHLDSLRGLHHLGVGGDVVSADHARKAVLALPGTRVINMYGPTESTTFACTHHLTSPESFGATVPIGRPIANTRVYVLDERREPQPVGVPGELHIGGDGVALGYWRREELTREKFVPDVFGTRPGALLYRTGDRVRRLPDGSIEYLGRLDQQVKVRGFRIEPGEVEHALLQLPEIREAVVAVRDELLVAYYLTLQGAELPGAEVRERLKKQLPLYLVPARYVKMAEFPMTPSGKVDRKRLPAPDGTRDVAAAYVAPKTHLERRIAGVWQEVLGVDRIGLEDNFFDLGGHSLLLVSVHARVQEFTSRPFPVVEMFRHPTVAALASYLRQEGADERSLEEARGQASKARSAILRQQQLRKDRRR